MFRLGFIVFALVKVVTADPIRPVTPMVGQPAPSTLIVQPLFEQQEAIWPEFLINDEEDLPSNIAASQQHVVAGAAAIEEQELAHVLPTFDDPADEEKVHAGYPVPIYEDQITAYPDKEDEQDTWMPHQNKYGHITVVENYQIINPDGTGEYKLVLSNGMRNYKKITKRYVGEKVIYVQKGYYSVPVASKQTKFNILHYIADENGYRVEKVEQCSEMQSYVICREPL